ncbi:MAG: hypothetical protein HFI44_15515 [Lachnospiraceae bacterium]|nr:hypothetical protein [Lachnospiraceae bacterium]
MNGEKVKGALRRCLAAGAYSQRPEPPVLRVAATIDGTDSWVNLVYYFLLSK